MKKEKLKEILLLGESQNVEFKSHCENLKRHWSVSLRFP